MNASGVATSSILYFSHKPPESLNVANPLSALIPAPVKITICFIQKFHLVLNDIYYKLYIKKYMRRLK